MSIKRRAASLLDYRLPRRIITIGGLVLWAAITLPLLPVFLLSAFVFDVLRRDHRRPRTRFVVLLFGAMLIEILGLIRLTFTWALGGFGLARATPERWHRQRRLIGWYTNLLFGLVVWVLGTEVIWRDNADLSSGPVVLIARHTSFFDALTPAIVLAKRNDLLAHHVVTRGLRYAPCIDIFGHRFPNSFISRSPAEGDNAVHEIIEVGTHLNDRSAAIIFPEGTFRSPARFDRALGSLERRAPHLVDRAADLRHVLPPRPAGTRALLLGAPDADVVVCVNTGLEPFGDLKSIITAPVADRPVIIETWRIPRSELPDVADEDAFTDWLFAEYARIDTWVSTTRSGCGG